MTLPLRLLFIWTGFLCSVVHAQEEFTEKVQEIEVKEIKVPELKPYRTMLKGAIAYDAYHDLAPQAPFLYILKARKVDLDINTVTLKIVGEEHTIPVPISPGGIFELPRFNDPEFNDADLVLNQKKCEKAIGWRPFIRSPGLNENLRRLGDLRLECEITWAIEQDDLSFIVRNSLKLIGGPCNSSHFRMTFDADHPRTEVLMRTPDRQQSLSLTASKTGYIVPLYDKTWPNDTLIELR
jgi:hypothetical protein